MTSSRKKEYSPLVEDQDEIDYESIMIPSKKSKNNSVITENDIAKILIKNKENFFEDLPEEIMHLILFALSREKDTASLKLSYNTILSVRAVSKFCRNRVHSLPDISIPISDILNSPPPVAPPPLPRRNNSNIISYCASKKCNCDVCFNGKRDCYCLFIIGSTLSCFTTIVLGGLIALKVSSNENTNIVAITVGAAVSLVAGISFLTPLLCQALSLNVDNPFKNLNDWQNDRENEYVKEQDENYINKVLEWKKKRDLQFNKIHHALKAHMIFNSENNEPLDAGLEKNTKIRRKV